MILTRRQALASAAVVGLPTACATVQAPRDAGFVRTDGLRFLRGDRPYAVAGTNMWYAAYLGADRPYGDRARLSREFARLAALGLTNVRILGASEESPLRGAVTPAVSGPGRAYDAGLLEGLDWAVAEMAKHGLTAVVYLGNFWEWSGGMAAYLTWVNGGRFVDMNDPANPWPAYPDFVAGFYGNEETVALYHAYVRALVGRTNSVTGRAYADDPTIMAWQLANEPRPAGSEAVGRRTLPHYQAWIRSTATLIKSLDRNHLVSTGAEGLIGCLEQEACVIEAAEPAEIDYMTIHIWPQNFGWVDPTNLRGTFDTGATRTRTYIDTHEGYARRLGKPMVLEEFGFPRDDGYEPGSATSYRDRFYDLVLGRVAEGAAAGGPLVGFNFWAWNGEGRAAHADHRYRPGDTAWLGDPSHEPQGWYGVFDADRSTQAVIRRHAARLAART